MNVVQGNRLLFIQAQKRVCLDFDSSQNCRWKLNGISAIAFGSLYGYKQIGKHTTRLLLEIYCGEN